MPVGSLPGNVDLGDILRLSMINGITKVLADFTAKEELPEQYKRAGFNRVYLYRCYQQEEKSSKKREERSSKKQEEKSFKKQEEKSSKEQEDWKMDLQNEKCVMVIDESLPLGIIANTAAIMGITLGKQMPVVVGADVYVKTGNGH